MARRKVHFGEELMAGARWKNFYPDVYSRTSDWQTRTGRRNRQFSTYSNLLGLNTAYDDLHRLDGESPYLRNVRYMGEKQKYQRAQVTSRQGLKEVSTLAEEDQFYTKNDMETYLEINEGKAFKMSLEHKHTLTRIQLFMNNYEGAKGRLKISIHLDENAPELCDVNIPLKATRNYEEFILRPVQSITQNMSGGKIWLRFDILDDIEPEETKYGCPIRERKIRLLATGKGNHYESKYVLPSQDKALKEIPPQWDLYPSAPMIGYSYTEYEPVKIIIGDNSNHTFKVADLSKQVDCDGEEYEEQKYHNYLFRAIRKTEEACGEIELWRTNLDTGLSSRVNAKINPKAQFIMGAKAKDFFYYVDGYSDLQRIKLDSKLAEGVDPESDDTLVQWKSEVAMPKKEDIDTDTPPEKLKAQKGASLLWHMKNRIYLAGFKDDPNFVQLSLINSKGDGVQYDQFAEYFYSPDASSKETTQPITALISDYTNSALLVFREDGAEAVQAPAGFEFGTVKKVDTPLYNIGVKRQSDVCSGNGSVYLYNQSEGLRRYSGAEATFQSHKVDNELRRMPEKSDTFMFAHANKVWFSFDREARGYADHTLIYHTILAQQSPWYMDENVPIKWAIGDSSSDTIYCEHANSPTLYIYGAENQYQDFDSSINVEYHTSYSSVGDPNGWSVVRRVVVRLISNDTRSWYIGVDTDKVDDPAVWRKYISGESKVDNGEVAVMHDDDTYLVNTVNIPMRIKARSFNIRVKTFSFGSPSMLEYISAELSAVQSR